VQPPAAFLEVLIRSIELDAELAPPAVGLCAGYELEVWRAQQFAAHLMEWLPEFALADQELTDFSPGSAVRMLRRAAALVYNTDKYERRGEFGELILHAVLRQEYGSEAAIKKLYFKDSRNDTVKGFDAVHVVPRGEDLELWLGEAKFYGDRRSAVAAALASLESYADKDYLRSEFMLIVNKLDKDWIHTERLKKLLDPNTSLDEVFAALRVPVLVTYDSDVVQSHVRHDADYYRAFSDEVMSVRASFADGGLPATLSVELIVIPLAEKRALLDALHEQLRAWQAI
jgi:hypothetical protein